MFFYNSFSCGNGIFVFTFVFVILHTNPLKTFLPLPSNRINGLRYIPPRPLYFIELALKAFNIKSINRSIHDDDDDLMGNYLSIFCFCFCYSFILQEYTPCELASLVFFFSSKFWFFSTSKWIHSVLYVYSVLFWWWWWWVYKEWMWMI